MYVGYMCKYTSVPLQGHAVCSHLQGMAVLKSECFRKGDLEIVSEVICKIFMLLPVLSRVAFLKLAKFPVLNSIVSKYFLSQIY